MFKYLSCPQCSGNLFLIDSAILPTIILLNKKGYPTNFCCSGHEKASYLNKNNQPVFYDTAPYIFFTHELTQEMGTPKGFYRDPDRYHGDKTIRGSLNKQKPIGEQILKLNKNLLQWAKELVPRKK